MVTDYFRDNCFSDNNQGFSNKVTLMIIKTLLYVYSNNVLI